MSTTENQLVARVYFSKEALLEDKNKDFEHVTDFTNAYLDCLYFVTEGKILKEGAIIEAKTPDNLLLTSNTIPGLGTYEDITVFNISTLESNNANHSLVATCIIQSNMTATGIKTEACRYRVHNISKLPDGINGLFARMMGLALNAYSKKVK